MYSLNHNIEKIVFKIRELDGPGFGLMNGKAGIGLFFANYLGKTKLDRYEVINYFQKTITEIEGTLIGDLSSLNFSDGICGILCTLKILEKENCFYRFDYDISNISEILKIKFKQFINSNNYEFLYGAGGLLQFFRKFEDFDFLDEAILLFRLKSENNSAWRTYNKRTFERDYVDLGVAHGIGGLIGIIGQCFQNLTDKENSIKLLFNLYEFYKKSEMKFENISLFPYGASNKVKNSSSRLAWCYGDPGIGLMFLNTGINTGNTELSDYGIKVLLHSSFRKNPETTQINNCFLCHGSSGLAMIFLNAFKKTGIHQFREASDFWMQYSLENFDEAIKMNYPGFLNGLAGLGLAILSYETNENLLWEDLLLLN